MYIGLRQTKESGLPISGSDQLKEEYDRLSRELELTQEKARLHFQHRREVEGAVALLEKQRAEVDEECPKCTNPRMLFWTRQLRSADEGQTVFYECPACEYRFSTNT